MNAIIDFQKKHGLKPDGVIGKITLLKIKEVLKIDKDEDFAHFMGQCAHESGNFSTVFENLNYSESGLLRVFPKYFNKTTAAKYQRNPEKIANKVYANRMGNGDEKSGDGFKHRGFGFIQLTGKLNQNKFSEYIGDENIKTTPSLIATEYAFESAKYFFDENKIWNYTGKIDKDSILNVSRIINLGNVKSKSIPNGMGDRSEKTIFYYNMLKK